MKSSSVIFPAASIPRASVSDVVSDFLPSKTTPPAMGPPVTMMAGMSSLAAAMSMPGKILSQGLAFGLHLESDDLFVGS
jgi:phosphoribosylcarboxyaminoimidazole (NCAIR) mutase